MSVMSVPACCESDLAALLRERDARRQQRDGDQKQPLNHDS